MYLDCRTNLALLVRDLYNHFRIEIHVYNDNLMIMYLAWYSMTLVRSSASRSCSLVCWKMVQDAGMSAKKLWMVTGNGLPPAQCNQLPVWTWLLDFCACHCNGSMEASVVDMQHFDVQICPLWSFLLCSMLYACHVCVLLRPCVCVYGRSHVAADDFVEENHDSQDTDGETYPMRLALHRRECSLHRIGKALIQSCRESISLIQGFTEVVKMFRKIEFCLPLKASIHCWKHWFTVESIDSLLKALIYCLAVKSCKHALHHIQRNRNMLLVAQREMY